MVDITKIILENYDNYEKKKKILLSFNENKSSYNLWQCQRLLDSLNDNIENESIKKDVLLKLFKNNKDENIKSLKVNGKFYCDFGSNIYFDKDVTIGNNVTFVDRDNIFIGKNVTIGNNVKILTIDLINLSFFDFVNKENLTEIELLDKKKEFVHNTKVSDCIIIGDNVTIEDDVTILKGVVISDNTVITKGQTIKIEKNSTYYKTSENDT